jgi:hypothetical protein
MIHPSDGPEKQRNSDMALTLQQLQANLDQIDQEIASAEQSVHFPDGRTVTKRPMAELLKARALIEDQIRTYGGKSDSKCTLGQHRRGDGPHGPGFPGLWN